MQNLSLLWRLKTNDFVRSALNAVFVAAVAVVWKGSQMEGFDILAIDWQSVLNAGIYGFIGYLTMHFSQNENGAVFGKLGGYKQELK